MQITQGMVSKIVKKANKNPEMIHELIEERMQTNKTRDDVAEFIHGINQADQFIESTKSIQRKLKAEKGLEINKRTIADIMKKDLGMSFREIQTVSVRTNSEKNLVLRQ